MELLHYEDLELGGHWTTRSRTITDADIAAFAGVSGDYGFLHTDGPRAAQGPMGGRVAHGSLLIAVALGLGSMDVPQPQTVALVGTNWRFMKPVKPGMTVHAGWRLGRKRDVSNPRWGLCAWQVELLDQVGDRVAEGEVTVLVARKEAAAPAPATRSRRRRGRGKSTAAAGPAPAVVAEIPEPAPADTPPPARRRRRRRGSGGGGGNGAPAPEPEPAAEPQRSAGWAQPEPEPQPAKAESGNAVTRALGRLRRPRQPKKTD